MDRQLKRLAVSLVIGTFCLPVLADNDGKARPSLQEKVKEGLSAAAGASAPAKRSRKAVRPETTVVTPVVAPATPAAVETKAAALPLFRENITQEEMMRFD